MRRIAAFYFILMGLMVSFWLTAPRAVYAIAGDGGSPGSFLKLGSGVRALSMGRAFVALADDATASYWNPAGLAQIKGREISFMYAEPFGKVAGITHQNIAYAWEGEHFNMGANLIYAGVEGLEGYDSNAESTKNFGSQEWALLFSMAYLRTANFAWGTTLKMVNQKIEDNQDSGYGVDVGMLFKGRKKPVQTGITMENLVPPALRLRDTTEYYPQRVHYGILIQPYKYRRILTTVLTADLITQKDTNLKQFYGMEAGLYKKIFLRGGFNTASEEQSYGLGLKAKKLSLDYAYLIHPYLGDTHRAGIALKF